MEKRFFKTLVAIFVIIILIYLSFSVGKLMMSDYPFELEYLEYIGFTLVGFMTICIGVFILYLIFKWIKWIITGSWK
jgi:Na+-transporting methylmalonyl-CoA/oxaloacetate decarboxylase beta subunit